MPKKYIQLLLSINFCLTAIAAAADSDAGSDDSFVVISDHEVNTPNDISSEGAEDNWVADARLDPTINPESSIEGELKDQFYHIWHRLEKINQIHPSELLQRFILAHQQRPVSYDESSPQKDLAQDIAVQFTRLHHDLEMLSKYKFKEELDRNSQAAIDAQFVEICDCLGRIYELYKSKTSLSKRDQFLLSHQLEELLAFSQSFLAESSGASELDNETLHFAKREASPFTDAPLSTRIKLDNQFNQIWSCLDKINAIHQSELLQGLISHHRNEKIPYNENLEEVSRETLENQFIQLQKALKICSQYQPEESLDEESKAVLDTQLDQIKLCLGTIYIFYELEKDLSKEEKAFLSHQLDELHNFSYNFISENSLQKEHVGGVELSSLDKIQMLLNSCEKEDSLIYPQYEYIINSQETNVSDLLTNSKTAENNIENHFLYFNKAEGLIEIQHAKSPGDEEYIESYTTTWRIRPADVNLVKNWQESDPITIDKTSIFSKYTMRGESLKYTLNNGKKSVRANFVCKSSYENTYTILSIDYLESIVILKNGPCLFVQDGDLQEWHVKDTVVLQRSGPLTDTNNSHQLINKTRNKTNWVSLKK